MSAAGRLWRRSPLWRGALLIGLPASGLAALFPPNDGRRPVAVPVTAIAPVPPAFVNLGETASPSLPPALPPAAPDIQPPTGTIRQRMLPFFDVPMEVSGARGDGWPSEEQIEQQEAGARPVFSASAPFAHREVALPPGDWISAAVDREYANDGGPPGYDEVFVRLQGHVVTGAVLLRGSDPTTGGAAFLPGNPACRPGRTLHVRRLDPPHGGEACWYVAWPEPPTLVWPLPDAPPSLRVAAHTLAANGDRLPQWLFGATYFHSDGHQWVEITYMFDPARSGVVPTGEDGKPNADGKLQGHAMAVLAVRLEAWIRLRLPLLENLGPTQLSPALAAAYDADVPR